MTVTQKQMLARPDSLDALTADEKVLMSFLCGTYGASSLTVGGEGFESCLSGRAARAILSLIARGLVSADLFNNTGRVTYRATEAAKPMKGCIKVGFVERHGRWSLTEPAE